VVAAAPHTRAGFFVESFLHGARGGRHGGDIGRVFGRAFGRGVVVFIGSRQLLRFGMAFMLNTH
jgi:hypothetical protein